MAPLNHPGDRLWRTDLQLGRSIYALLSNDVEKTSSMDPLIGVMETSELAEDVVNTHNDAMKKFGRRYRKVLAAND